MDARDRQRGALLGLAIGDALGAAIEFSPPGRFSPVDDFRGGGPFGLAPGEWTDDTSMALALADSIARAGWNPADQLDRYLRWYHHGEYSVNGRCFDIGTTTAQALARYEQTRDPMKSGSTDRHASGNGSIMRLAPVPIAFSRLLATDLETLVERLIGSSQTTHGSPSCLSAAAYLGLLLAGFIAGAPRDEVLDPAWPPLVRLQVLHPLDPEVAEVAAGSYRRKQPPAIKGSGHVVRSLEAALWAFHDATDYAQAVLRAVNLGDDADTTGAVCGQLAGAHWGESGLPAPWLARLARRDLIDPILDRLLAVS